MTKIYTTKVILRFLFVINVEGKKCLYVRHGFYLLWEMKVVVLLFKKKKSLLLKASIFK